MAVAVAASDGSDVGADDDGISVGPDDGAWLTVGTPLGTGVGKEDGAPVGSSVSLASMARLCRCLRRSFTPPSDGDQNDVEEDHRGRLLPVRTEPRNASPPAVPAAATFAMFVVVAQAASRSAIRTTKRPPDDPVVMTEDRTAQDEASSSARIGISSLAVVDLMRSEDPGNAPERSDDAGISQRARRKKSAGGMRVYESPKKSTGKVGVSKWPNNK